MYLSLLIFALSAVVIVFAGAKLSQYGDQIADETGLGRLWVGVVLIAGATSLPELVTDISAVRLGAPDLAVGDLFGSSMTNMLILGVIDLIHRQKRVWQRAALEQTLSAALAVILTCMAGLFVALRTDLDLRVAGLETFFIALLYVLGMRVVYRQEDVKRRQRALELVREPETGHAEAKRGGLKRAAIGFSLASLAILVAAPALAISAKSIAEQSGISSGFMGTLFVGAVTSLPELVTALAAVRLGAFDLAVGNLFGSNAFNMFALFLVDLANPSGPLLAAVSATHALTAFLAILLMNIGLMGIIYRAEKRFLLIEPDSALMIVGYVLGMWMLYQVAG